MESALARIVEADRRAREMIEQTKEELASFDLQTAERKKEIFEKADRKAASELEKYSEELSQKTGDAVLAARAAANEKIARLDELYGDREKIAQEIFLRVIGNGG
ncbi:MAG: hypothetical protein K6C36_09675 [Clostridia bacterium]|nr:hypothetical protein [Clostridia bacterium]